MLLSCFQLVGFILFFILFAYLAISVYPESTFEILVM